MSLLTYTTTPVFEHDCSECKYLYTAIYSGTPYDVYHCSNYKPQFVIRFSSEPCDNITPHSNQWPHEQYGPNILQKALSMGYTMERYI